MFESIVIFLFFIVGIAASVYGFFIQDSSGKRRFKHDKISLSFAIIMFVLMIAYLLLTFNVFN